MQVQNRHDNFGKWNLAVLDELPEPLVLVLAQAERVEAGSTLNDQYIEVYGDDEVR